MTIAQIRKLHRNEGVAIICAASTNAKSGFVDNWDFLQMVANLEDVEEVIASYEAKGLINVVPVSVSDDIEISGSLAAKFFRSYFCQECLLRFILYPDEL